MKASRMNWGRSEIASRARSATSAIKGCPFLPGSADAQFFALGALKGMLAGIAGIDSDNPWQGIRPSELQGEEVEAIRALVDVLNRV